jgi:alpha-N-arabinofuranosidase
MISSAFEKNPGMKFLLSFLILSLSLSNLNTIQAQNSIRLKIDQSKETINKNIYGHFAEHLGHCIYNGFYVGDTNRTIPNSEGVRLDIIQALKKLKVPVLRWPGGCFADTYHWKDGVGPKNKRPSIVNRWWGGVTEDNSFGTHDFLNMCEKIGAEPYLTGNVGSGSVQDFSDWVQYVNLDGPISPMSAWRIENGRTQAWKVKYWGIGNEAWGCGGNMKPDYYANLFRQFSTFLPSGASKTPLFRIASGASDADYNWTETLMKNIPLNLIEGIAIHHYSLIDWNAKGSATQFSEEQYFTILKSALQMDELVSRHSAIMDEYDPDKKIALVVDEWGGWYDVEPGTNPGFLFQQNTMRDAMVAGLTLNIFNNHCDRVRMANLAQTVNVLQAVVLTQGTKMILTPTYHVMEMMNVHQNAKMIPLEIKSDDYAYKGDKLPAISSSASRDSAGTIHISLVNMDPHESKSITLKIPGAKVQEVKARILSSKHLQDYNSFEQPDKIHPEAFMDFKTEKETLTLKIPPFSVMIISLL